MYKTVGTAGAVRARSMPLLARELERAARRTEARGALDVASFFTRLHLELLGEHASSPRALDAPLQRFAKLLVAQRHYASARAVLRRLVELRTDLHGERSSPVRRARRALEEIAARRDRRALTPSAVPEA